MRLTMTAPLPGLPTLTDFTLTGVEGAVGLFTLQSEAEPQTRMYLLDPAAYIEGYSPAVPGRTDGDELFVVAQAGETGTTVNLLAPIVVNRNAKTAAQVILDGYPVRAPLAAA